jgi:hypothetical protein
MPPKKVSATGATAL